MDVIKVFLNLIAYVSVLFVTWTASYLEGRSHYTKIGHVISDREPGRCGIPQGTVLGPIYFLVYMNRLLELFTEGEAVSFADDTAYIVSGNGWDQAVRKAEQCIAKSQKCLTELGMKINVSKTSFIAFSMREAEVPNIGSIKCHGAECDHSELCLCPTITQVSSTRYLGVDVDQCLRWDQHVKNLTSKMRKLVYVCREVRNFLSNEVRKMLYFALVQSRMIYGVSGWGGCGDGLLEAVYLAQKLLIKVLLKKPTRYSTAALFEEFKVMKFRDLRDTATIIKTFRDAQRNELQFLEEGCTRIREPHLLKIPFRKTLHGQQAYDYRGDKLFNALPYNIRTIGKLESFKKELKAYVGIKNKS